MTTKPIILVTHRVHAQVQERLAAHGVPDINPSTEPWPRSEIMRRLAPASAMMGFMTDCVDASLLLAAPQLKVIACALKGYDNYDVTACTHAGVWLTIVPDLLTEPTAELAMGLAIALARHVRPGDAYVRSGQFAGWRSHWFGTGLHGSVVALVGLGKVGQAIAQRLAGFGCASLLGVDPVSQLPGVQRVDLLSALQQADYVFLSAPLTPASMHMLGPKELAMAKPGQHIINVGRGSVVDEVAMTQALQSGRIAGYAADVFACEDWGLPEHPKTIAPELLAQPNTVFTPHLGSAVAKVRLAIEHCAADNILAVLQGQAPPNTINKPWLSSV